jgi:hypothetical protein
MVMSMQVCARLANPMPAMNQRCKTAVPAHIRPPRQELPHLRAAARQGGPRLCHGRGARYAPRPNALVPAALVPTGALILLACCTGPCRYFCQVDVFPLFRQLRGWGVTTRRPLAAGSHYQHPGIIRFVKEWDARIDATRPEGEKSAGRARRSPSPRTASTPRSPAAPSRTVPVLTAPSQPSLSSRRRRCACTPRATSCRWRRRWSTGR